MPKTKTIQKKKTTRSVARKNRSHQAGLIWFGISCFLVGFFASMIAAVDFSMSGSDLKSSALADEEASECIAASQLDPNYASTLTDCRTCCTTSSCQTSCIKEMTSLRASSAEYQKSVAENEEGFQEVLEETQKISTDAAAEDGYTSQLLEDSEEREQEALAVAQNSAVSNLTPGASCPTDEDGGQKIYSTKEECEKECEETGCGGCVEVGNEEDTEEEEDLRVVKTDGEICFEDSDGDEGDCKSCCEGVADTETCNKSCVSGSSSTDSATQASSSGSGSSSESDVAQTPACEAGYEEVPDSKGISETDCYYDFGGANQNGLCCVKIYRAVEDDSSGEYGR